MEAFNGHGVVLCQPGTSKRSNSYLGSLFKKPPEYRVAVYKKEGTIVEESYKKTFQRIDQQKKGHANLYSPAILFLLILVGGLNILDSLFTMTVLDSGGHEINPIVRSVIALYGDRFWVWKFFIVSASSVILCFYSNFRLVKFTILGISAIYVSTILYQIFLIG